MNKYLNMYFEKQDDGKGGEPPKDNIPPVDPPKDEPPKDEPKTFTQDELNTLLANEKKSAKAKILKDFGVDDPETIKALIKKQKEDEEKNKTASEKLTEKEKLLEEQSKKLASYEARDKAIELGVDTSKAKEFIKLANTIGEGETIEDKINDTLTKYPFYKKDAQPTKFGTKTGGKPSTSEDDMNLVKKYMNM